MRRTQLKSKGKRSRERERGMRDAAPIVCNRAGGEWCGRTGERCVGAQCEMVDENGVRCNNYGWWFPLAHIQGRGVGGREKPENLMNLCLSCHDLMDHGPADVREAMRERARRIVSERNEAMT